MEAYQLTCPSCGAVLNAPEDRDIMYCEYCGTQIHVHDENVKRIEIKKDVTHTIVKRLDFGPPPKEITTKDIIFTGMMILALFGMVCFLRFAM